METRRSGPPVHWHAAPVPALRRARCPNPVWVAARCRPVPTGSRLLRAAPRQRRTPVRDDVRHGRREKLRRAARRGCSASGHEAVRHAAPAQCLPATLKGEPRSTPHHGRPADQRLCFRAGPGIRCHAHQAQCTADHGGEDRCGHITTVVLARVWIIDDHDGGQTRVARRRHAAEHRDIVILVLAIGARLLGRAGLARHTVAWDHRLGTRSLR